MAAAVLSFAVSTGLSCGRWNRPCCPKKFQSCSLISSSHFNKLWSNGVRPRCSSPLSISRRHNAAAVSCTSSSSDEVGDRLTSRQKAQLKSSELLASVNSAQWQGLGRCAIQISALLVLANALHSDIALPDPYDTFENVPQDISGGEERKRIQRPKSKKAERCTQKCLGTCIRGGAGSPGEGPFNIRKPLVVFKEGFRTRQYCLIECSEICNLIGDGDDGP
ncbi:unnamed protein product [Calypogeia fissa]